MIREKLAELGYEFEPADLDVASFQSAVRVGNLVYTSGQVPDLGETSIRGKVGADLTVEQAYAAAEICAVNALRAVAAVADVDSILRIVKVLGFVNVAPGFDNTSAVVNGATDLFKAVLGPSGNHARSAVGVVVPGNWAVEIEVVVELDA